MPEPIRPVPTTPIVCTCRGVDALQPGHLGRGALGEEHVAQRLGLVGIAQSQECRAFLGQALPPARTRPALRTRRTASTGACWPRARDSAFAAACSIASASAGGTASSPVRRSALADKVLRRRNRFARRGRRRRPGRRCRATAPRRPSRCGRCAISSTAAATPVSRGRRCVPPAPGTMPSFTSGRPSFASATAMRWWQPSAISSPPPSAAPLIAATTGLPLASISVDHLRQRRLGHRRCRTRGCRRRRRNCVPAPVMTTALTSSRRRRHGRSPRTGRRAWRPTRH